MENGHAEQHPPRKRRHLSGEKKYLVLEEVKAHPERKGEILRREGLFQADLDITKGKNISIDISSVASLILMKSGL